MSTPEKIRAFLESADEKPAASKLEEYTELIRILRSRRWTYTDIAKSLKDEFGLVVAASSIHNFVKVRAKSKKAYALHNPLTPPKDSTHTKTEQATAPKPRFKVDL